MLFRVIQLGLCFVVLASAQIFAETVYTWTDANGIIHVSKNKPPEDARQPNRVAYTPTQRTEKKEPPFPQADKDRESLWLKALQQAKLERENADTARQKAEKAIQAANRLKQETEDFLEPWRNRKRIKRDMLSQIDRRIQTTNE